MAPLRDRRSNVAEMPLDELEYEEPSRPQSDEDEADETMAVAAELIAKVSYHLLLVVLFDCLTILAQWPTREETEGHRKGARRACQSYLSKDNYLI